MESSVCGHPPDDIFFYEYQMVSWQQLNVWIVQLNGAHLRLVFETNFMIGTRKMMLAYCAQLHPGLIILDSCCGAVFFGVQWQLSDLSNYLLLESGRF